MKGTIELVAGSGLDKTDIEEIQNAIEAAIQGTRYEDMFSVTTAREIDSDTSIYYLRVSAPSGWTTDNYAEMERRLRSSLLCYVEFAESPCSSTAHLSDAPLTEPSIPAFEPTESKPPPTRASHGQPIPTHLSTKPPTRTGVRTKNLVRMIS